MAVPKFVTVRVVPLSGTPTEHTVAYLRGMTVEEALQAAGVSSERKDVSIQASLGKSLQAGDTVVAAETHVEAGSQVTVTERPQGS